MAAESITNDQVRSREIEKSPQFLATNQSVDRQNTLLSAQIIAGPSQAFGSAESTARLAATSSKVAKLEKAYRATPVDEATLLQRIDSYVCAQLHPKGKSISCIIEPFQTSDKKNDDGKIYHKLWAGRQWKALLGLFGSTAQNLGKGKPGSQPYGIFCLLHSEHIWLRATKRDRRTALVNLCVKTNFCEQTVRYNNHVRKVIYDIRARRSFVHPEAVPKPPYAHMLLQRPRTPSSIIRPRNRTSPVNPRCARAAPTVRGFFSDPHSPSPPQALLVSENLFHNIKLYFENSCRNMIFDDYGTLLTPNGAKLDNALNDFDSYCFTATMLVEKGLYVEFRRTLSKASALVEQILRAEHPRTLAYFLEVFIHLTQTGLSEVASFLRDYIKRMSEEVTRKGHPWGQICRLLGELDSGSLEQAMAQIWKCITDILDSELGTFSRFAVSVRLDYVKRMVTSRLEEEQLLRGLLAQFGGIPRLPTPRVMLNLAHNLDRQGRHDEAEEMALEVLSLLQGHEIYAWRIVERIESMKVVSRSQFSQGKILAAEQTMRDAIRIIVDEWGIQHSWVPEFMHVLEGWVRGWGRKEEADTLRREIEELMGRDESDEWLNRVQGLLC